MKLLDKFEKHWHKYEKIYNKAFWIFIISILAIIAIGWIGIFI
jgi:hypothetical protein